MATPTRSTLTDLDPLQPLGEPRTAQLDPTLSPEPPANSTSPVSFKRRTPSRGGVGAKASSVLAGILSRSPNSERDMVPPPAISRPAAPTQLELPSSQFRRPSESGFSQAIASDDEDDIAEEGSAGRGTSSTLGEPGWKRRATAGGGARLSFAPGTAGSRPMRAYSAPSTSPTKDTRVPFPGGDLDEDGSGGDDGAAFAVTPLPKIPMIVLCVALFGEFLSASISSPFLFFMVESFGVGQGPNGGGESAVSLWTGVVAAVFFLSQFSTALLWVSVAEKHGRRAVLFASLVGNGLTVMAFGTSKNLGSAICIRLAMGLFNGAVGVARSAVQAVTDDTNRSTAYTYVGLLWGLGGIVGSVLGGVLESPVKNYPSIFGDYPLFDEYPYLLPCLVAGCVTLFGGFLSLFLDRDGGQRTGGIHLPTEKDVEVAAGKLEKLRGWIAAVLSNLFSRMFRRRAIQLSPNNGNVLLRPSSGEVPPLASPAPSPSIMDSASERNPLSDRRASTRHYGTGSAYGYSRRTSASQSGFERDSGLRIPSMRRRGGRSVSMVTSNRYDPENDLVDHSFAERLLLANNQAVFNLSDVFLAKAAADDQLSQMEYEGSVFERDGDEEYRIEGTDMDANSEYDVGFGSAPPSIDDLRGEAVRQDLMRTKDADSVARWTSPVASLPQSKALRSPTGERVISYVPSIGRLRRGSAASSVRPMSIFSNSGLNPETIAASAGQLATASSYRPDESGFAPMAAIPEMRQASIIEREEGEEAEKMSPLSQLPLALVFQYSLLALHGTVCDQVFTSFLVAPIASGGLGLRASHYAALIATMFFFSLVWQFRFYPSIGPPNGSFSHLAMFRLGLILYVPVYFLLPELRGLIIVEGENLLVMTGMVVLSAIRYLANACAYTAVMVLINVMTPVEYVPLANGLAQSCVSFARFLGPLVGGSVFAASIADKSNPHPAVGFHLIACLCLLGFLLSWRIR
ncbi:hypothetical protein JCM21900_000859 [Sporobolomyces salmonicolor]